MASARSGATNDNDADIGALASRSQAFKQRLRDVKRGIGDVEFYPYDTFGSLYALDRLLPEPHRNLAGLAGGLPIADIGAADGDLSFFLESMGFDMHIIDHASTNHNGLRGARALKRALSSRVEIHDINLDDQFSLPQEQYGLVFFLGILYHLKNPYYALEKLAARSRHIVLSTRIAQYGRSVWPLTELGRLASIAADGGGASRFVSAKHFDQFVKPMVKLGLSVSTRLARSAARVLDVPRFSQQPVGYLVDERECNNDPTNFWMFSPEGLRRLLKRTGWEILSERYVGNQLFSDPASDLGDERGWCLARSRVA